MHFLLRISAFSAPNIRNDTSKSVVCFPFLSWLHLPACAWTGRATRSLQREKWPLNRHTALRLVYNDEHMTYLHDSFVGLLVWTPRNWMITQSSVSQISSCFVRCICSLVYRRISRTESVMHSLSCSALRLTLKPGQHSFKVTFTLIIVTISALNIASVAVDRLYVQASALVRTIFTLPPSHTVKPILVEF